MEEYERLTEPGAKGALLRREGLYHSHIVDWRTARDAGALDALAARPTGPPGKSAAQKENDKLQAENKRLAAELAKSQKAPARDLSHRHAHGRAGPQIGEEELTPEPSPS